MSIAERLASLPSIKHVGEPMAGVREPGQVPTGGWLRAMREARGVTQRELAAKLGFRRQAWAQFEASEARGAITLASLRRAADVLGCDLVYGVVPRESLASTSGSVEQSPEITSRVKTVPAAAGFSGDTATSAWFEPELPTELK